MRTLPGRSFLPVCVLMVSPLVFLAATCGRLQSAEQEVFRWVDHPESGTADLMLGDAPVIRYMYAFDTSTDERQHETYKVFHHVFGPGSENVITKGPGGKYTHHRGLFIGWNKTSFGDQTLDFWHCKNGAHLRHVRFLDQTADRQHGSMTAEIHWNDAESNPVITELRTVSVTRGPETNGPDTSWQIDWKTSLTSHRGTIELSGDRQHAGFQYRAAQHVADVNGARYIRPAGFPEQSEAFQVNDKGNPPAHIDLGWFAMTYELDGQQYTVEYFEDADLPKPSLFSERPYGRFGAFFKTTLESDQPFEMRYRLIVTSGDPPKRNEIDKRYRQFIE